MSIGIKSIQRPIIDRQPETGLPGGVYVQVIIRLYKVIGHRYAAWVSCCFRYATNRSPLRGFCHVPASLHKKEVAAMRLSPCSCRFALQRGRRYAAWDRCEIILLIIRLAKTDCWQMGTSKTFYRYDLSVALSNYQKQKAA